MNLFLVNKNIQECVHGLCDKHVIKMILETAQMVYSAWHVRSPLPPCGDLNPYRKTHVNHPMSIWVRHSVYHYQWACMYGILLCYEYTHRYGRIHKTQAHLERLYSWGYPPKSLDDVPVKKQSKQWINATSGIPNVFEYFPLCMDDAYYVQVDGMYDAELSYQKYYQTKQDKFKMVWTNADVPKWFTIKAL